MKKRTVALALIQDNSAVNSRVALEMPDRAGS